ncbi:permease [Sphingomonas sp. CGMCC 1.13654]|uniref:Permease n=1 Tax=Sphingomonas chungangi TaxID=2683589 RepID=A0A838LGI3_9SPHN|nr:permease [Sphingomonas chungangi]MBA2936538.1 permease [Sphingomonas chungangi]MVW55923.1 permease [Sphingomonas chungangi]
MSKRSRIDRFADTGFYEAPNRKELFLPQSRLALMTGINLILKGLVLAAAMAWKTGWSLVLGFTVSAVLQSIVAPQALREKLGSNHLRPVAIATLAGAASSSCSYASAAIMRTLFKKGAALGPSLAFLVASTNLVLELGVILWLLLGWRFMLAEWLGGLVLIAIMVPLSRAFVSQRLIEAARDHEEAGRGHDHGAMTLSGETWRDRLRDPKALNVIAAAFAMDWRMLWKDLVAGFLIAGMLSAVVPGDLWRTLFLSGLPEGWRVFAEALIGPLVAILTFVCSIGNVPLAATLWGGGVGFVGVLAFLYADLIVLPLIDAYRRYFGLKMALAIAATLYVSMVVAALVMGGVFDLTGLTPKPVAGVQATLATFAFDYSFYLNVIAALLAGWLFWKARPAPMHDHSHHGHTAA